jgi:hypothetical protein
MPRKAALASGRLRFLARPFVRGALLVRGAAAFAGNLALFIPIHRRKPTIFDSHEISVLIPCNLTSISARPKNHEKSTPTSTDGRALSGFAM